MTHAITTGSRTQYKFSFRRELLPPARSFYEKELGKLSRPSRGWVRGRCPFHQSKSGLSFSMNLDSGGFYCFGCDAKGGDVVDFVKLRDRVDFRRAAQLLGAWREEDLSETERRDLQKQKLEREQGIEREVIAAESARRARVEARDSLHAVEKLYREAIAEHNWDLMSELLPRVRQLEELYWKAAGLEVRHEC